MFLRTVVAVVAGTLVLGFVACTSAADDEKAVVDAIRKAGGSVTLDDKAPDKPVIFVNLEAGKSKKLTDEDIAKVVPQLVALKSLRGVHLGQRKVSDSTLQLISQKLPDLQVLGLNDAVITDDGLKVLAGMKKLQKIELNGVV